MGLRQKALWDFFLLWDRDRGALQRDWKVLFLWRESAEAMWDLDVLFLQWDRNNDGLQQWDLFPNVHALHVGDLFIISNVRDAK
jgi:hypothetical protein